MAVRFTDEQLTAIKTRDKTLLVSAAAGSGKTATLTERIIRSLTDEEAPEDVSQLLIVTFTKAAVGDLKKKISAAITKALADSPENKRLERQLTLLPLAHISTIDSFCNEVLRRNSDKVGIPPNYRIAETAEAQILSFSLLGALIDAIYDDELPSVSSAAEFAELGELLTSSKRNADLEEVLLKLYEKSKSTVEGVTIFRRLAEEYSPESALDNKYRSYAARLLNETAKHYFEHLTSGIFFDDDDSTPERRQRYLEAAQSDAAAIAEMRSADYARGRELLESLKIKNLPTLKGEKSLGERHYIAFHADMKAELADLRSKLFLYSDDEWRELYRGLNSKLLLLASVLEEFDRAYNAEKRRRAMLEFSDVERYTYLVLYNEDGTPSDAALALREEYSSVYVDEYQDVNALQNAIFAAVSRDNNRFMVGDIKQSIYGFRSADPDIFAAMKKSYPPLDEDAGSPCATLFMSKNFRCDRAIVDFVNEIFDTAFGLTRESIGYTPKDRLEYAKLYDVEPPYHSPSLTLVPPTRSEDSLRLSGDRAAECELVADKVRELIDNATLNGGEPVRPRDVAIILRGGRARMEDYAAALAKRGIPAESRGERSFFLNSDVLLALCLLNAVDNPRRDIYLAGLMLSPLFGFTEETLLALRRGKRGALIDSVRSYCESHPSFEAGRVLIETLDRYRTLAEGLNVDALILRLYNETGLLALAEKNGGKENLLLLYDYAKRFTASSYKGLYNFLKFINNVIDRHAEFDTGERGGGDDAVSLLTVHASKGLEYPIVFYVDTEAKLKGKESKERVIFSEKCGLGLYLRSPGGLALVENPVRCAILDYTERRAFEEELRVIYVALTRARERLYVYGCLAKDANEYLEEAELRRSVLDGHSIYSAKSALDVMTATQRSARISVAETGEKAEATDAPRSDVPREAANDDAANEIPSTELLKSRFEFTYPKSYLTRLPEKLSVSVLTPQALDAQDEDEKPRLILERTRERAERRGRLPEFFVGTSADESAKRGIATHNFLQFFDIEAFAKNGAAAELRRLTEKKFLSEETAARVRLDEIELFGKSKLLAEMQGARKLYRELRFNTRLPARFFTRDPLKARELADEEILVQGVIDCIVEDTSGELHLVDYKTDRLSRSELANPELARRTLNEKHALQLNYYALAIERIFGKAPTSIRIYSLPLGMALNVDKLHFE